MTLPVQIPALPSAPKEYDDTYLTSLVQALQLYFRNMNTVGPVAASSINITAVASAPHGLAIGQLYQEGGIVKIVLPGNVWFTLPPVMIGTLGTVTVTTP